MEILFTITSYPPSRGGTQILQHRIARELSARHRVRVLSYWDRDRTDWLLGTTLLAPGRARRYEIEGIDVTCLGIPPADKLAIVPAVASYYACMSWALPQIVGRLERLMEPLAGRVDLVHNTRQGREGISYASLRLARKQGVPFVLTPAHHPRWKGWPYEAFTRLYREADAVIALSEGERSLLLELGVREERITITGTAPVLAERRDAAGFRARHGIPGPAVLFVGTMFPYKGYRQVLEAMPLVWKSVPDTHFVFLGRDVGASAREFGAFRDEPRVHRLAAADDQEKTDAYAACTVFCMPSTEESFGIAYAEAWTFGKPVIGCPIPAVSTVVADGDDGFLVSQDAASVARRIVDLLRDEALAGAMGARGAAKVAERYTWPKVAQRTEEAYRKAMGAGAAG